MKKLLFILLFSATMYSQEQTGHNNTERELNLETNTGKFAQGALTGTLAYLATKQAMLNADERDKWLAVPIAMVTAFVFELVGNNKKTTTEKQLFAVAGAVSVSVTIELFNKKRRY